MESSAQINPLRKSSPVRKIVKISSSSDLIKSEKSEGSISPTSSLPSYPYRSSVSPLNISKSPIFGDQLEEEKENLDVKQILDSKQIEAKNILLKQNEFRGELLILMDKIDSITPVDFRDSSTGAIIGLTEDSRAIVVLKSNDEAFSEYAGNKFARILEISVPDFALIKSTEMENIYKEIANLRQRQRLLDYPVMVSRFMFGKNIKDITYTDLQEMKIDEQLFNELGKVLFLDVFLGNFDRFPVFGTADSQGNKGNILYNPNTKRFIFIDNVLMKHASFSNFGTEEYCRNFGLTGVYSEMRAYYEEIRKFLNIKNKDVSSNTQDNFFDSFLHGFKEAVDKIKSSKQEIEDIFQTMQENINIEINECISILLKQLAVFEQKIIDQKVNVDKSTLKAEATDKTNRIKEIINGLDLEEKIKTDLIQIFYTRGFFPKVGKYFQLLKDIPELFKLEREIDAKKELLELEERNKQYLDIFNKLKDNPGQNRDFIEELPLTFEAKGVGGYLEAMLNNLNDLNSVMDMFKFISESKGVINGY